MLIGRLPPRPILSPLLGSGGKGLLFSAGGAGPAPYVNVNSFYTNGLTDLVDLGTAVRPAANQKWFWSGWGKAGLTSAALFGNQLLSGSFRGLQFAWRNGAADFILSWIGSAGDVDVRWVNPPANVYNHLVLASDGSGTAAGCKFWVNAVLKTPFSSTGTIVTAAYSRNTYIGYGGDVGFHEGYTDNVCWGIGYGSDWTDADVAELYNGGVPPDVRNHSRVADIQTWLPIGEFGDTDSLLQDQIGSNHGAASGLLVADIP